MEVPNVKNRVFPINTQGLTYRYQRNWWQANYKYKLAGKKVIKKVYSYLLKNSMTLKEFKQGRSQGGALGGPCPPFLENFLHFASIFCTFWSPCTPLEIFFFFILLGFFKLFGARAAPLENFWLRPWWRLWLKSWNIFRNVDNLKNCL